MADEVPINVYDILSPSPPALKEIVYTSIATQLWRQEINTHRIMNTLNQLNLEQNILSKSSVPAGLADTDLSAIEKYVRRIGPSIARWLQFHFYPQLLFKYEIFNDFIDLAVNFDGTIDFVRTAKRLVLCEKIEPILRFKIACRFCFEDDILRIWPSVSSHVNLESVSYSNDTLLYYWICRLRNQLYRLPSSDVDRRSIEEQLIDKSYCPASAVEFFWNRLDADRRIYLMTLRYDYYYKHYRYMLRKFNEAELNRFANHQGYNMLSALLFVGRGNIEGDYYLTRDNSYVYRTRTVYDSASKALLLWTCIKEKMNERIFFDLVRKIIIKLHQPRYPIDTCTCCKLWNTAPDNLKLHAIRQLSLENSLFQRYRRLGTSDIDGSFIWTVLSDASAEDKRAFWDKHWRSLIDIMCTKDFDQLMRQCFSNDENQIIDFKQNTLSGLAHVRIKSSRLLNNLFVEELDQFLKFCYPDEQRRKNLQLNLLRDEFKVGVGNIMKISPLLNDFINDTYDDVNLAEHFKTQLLFSPSTIATFAELIESPSYGYDGKFLQDVRFIDFLAPSEPVARHLKKLYFIPLLKQKLLVGNFKDDVAGNEFSNFIRGCFTTEDETAESKEKLSVDEIVQHVIRSAIFGNKGPKYNSLLVQFLEWYFITPQALEEFKAKYADDDVFVQLTTRSK